MSGTEFDPGMVLSDPIFEWTHKTMQIINELTPDVKDKEFDPDWFLLRQRFKQTEKDQYALRILLRKIAVQRHCERMGTSEPTPLSHCYGHAFLDCDDKFCAEARKATEG
jgi:hypothetical protein